MNGHSHLGPNCVITDCYLQCWFCTPVSHSYWSIALLRYLETQLLPLQVRPLYSWYYRSPTRLPTWAVVPFHCFGMPGPGLCHWDHCLQTWIVSLSSVRTCGKESSIWCSHKAADSAVRFSDALSGEKSLFRLSAAHQSSLRDELYGSLKAIGHGLHLRLADASDASSDALVIRDCVPIRLAPL